MASAARTAAGRRAGWSTRAGGLVVALLGLAGVARAEGPDDLPAELEGVGIEARPDAALPLDAIFADEDGKAVRLGDYLRGERAKPTLLILAYFRCPQLCGLVLNAAVDGLKGLTWTPGEEFQVLTISIDPREDAALGREKKANLLAAYGRPSAAAGWHFLTGGKGSIEAVTQAVGFKYRYLPERNDFAHAAGIFVLTPEGRLSRTITGLLYEPRTLRLSLVEAADGKIGTVLDQIVLYCFHYDPKRGQYTPVVMNIVRLAGGITVLFVFGMVAVFLRQERRATRLAAERAAASPAAATETLGTP